MQPKLSNNRLVRQNAFDLQQRLSTFALEKLNQKQVFNMQEVLNLINEMSPYLLLGFFFAGVMHAFIPSMMYNRYLGGKGFKSVFYGALLGIPLPLCSCGVIPTAMSLRKQGASRGATASFLIATPETGVDSIIATYSILGLPFAIIRPIAALCNAIMGGWLIDNFGDKEEVVSADTSAKHCCCHNEHNHEECTCSCQHDKAQSHHNGILGKMLEALRYGFVEMMGDIGKWLVVGLVIAGLITVFVPEDFFALFRGNTQLSMLLVLCIAIPMYICATGYIPIAVALMMKGLTPGAALVLLMAGPACNMASILVINKTLGRKSLVLYLVSIITMAIIWGHIVDYLLPAEWFQIALANDCCGIEESASWLNWSSTIVLGILLLNALWQHYRHPHCH